MKEQRTEIFYLKIPKTILQIVNSKLLQGLQ